MEDSIKRDYLPFDPAVDPEFERLSEALSSLVVKRQLHLTACERIFRKKVAEKAIKAAGGKKGKAGPLVGMDQAWAYHYGK